MFAEYTTGVSAAPFVGCLIVVLVALATTLFVIYKREQDK